MLIGEIVEQLNGDETTTTIGKKLNRNKTTISKALKELGYEYVNSTKLWTFVGEGEPPTDTNIVDVIGTSKPRTSPQKDKKPTGKVNAPDTSNGLTMDDIRVLKAIVKQYNEGATTIEVNDTLHSRIIQLDPDAKRTRKTVFLNEEVSSQLDGFAKRNRVNNSDIVELAVKDFIEKYKN